MSLDRPSRLLIGVNGAHSGSSSTYVTLGRVPDDAAYEAVGTLSFSQPADAPRVAPRAPAAAAILRQGRGAGLLGAVFTPNPAANALTVSVAVGNRPPSSDAPGLAPDEAQAVLDGIKKVARSPVLAELGAGRLDVRWARAHSVDSSQSGFEALAGRMPALLTLSFDASVEMVQRAWQRQSETLQIGPYLDHLAALCDTRPDLCAFGQGVAEAKLAGFEVRLGVALPETLRMTLARIDGGWFGAGAPGDVPPTGHAACALLSLAEMEAAYFGLIASHRTHVELDGWQGHRAVRPRLRLPDGSCAAWPYLPVARTIEGEALVLEALGAPWRSRVLGACRKVGPRDWPVRYASHADFFEEFVAMGGVLAP